jgi:hypothetical protein
MSCRISENVQFVGSPDLVLGEIVHMTGNNIVDRATGDTAPHVRGTIGVTLSPAANGATVPILTNGKGTVLMESGLTGVTAGQTIYVSPNVDGEGTNVAPPLAVAVGTIKDASNYGVNQTVIADVAVQPGSTAGGGAGSISVSGAETDEVGTDGAEQVVCEWYVNFAGFSGPDVNFDFGFIGRSMQTNPPATVSPSVRLRVGATTSQATAGSAVVGAPVSLNATALTKLSISGAVVTPVGRQLVQLTVTGGTNSDSDPLTGLIRSVFGQITG